MSAVLAAASGGTAAAQERDAFDATAMLRVRIPFGPEVQDRARTVSLVSAAGMTPQIDAYSPNPPPKYRLVEAGLAFNGDAFVNLPASQAMWAVRAGPGPDAAVRRAGGRLPTPNAFPALP